MGFVLIFWALVKSALVCCGCCCCWCCCRCCCCHCCHCCCCCRWMTMARKGRRRIWFAFSASPRKYSVTAMQPPSSTPSRSWTRTRCAKCGKEWCGRRAQHEIVRDGLVQKMFIVRDGPANGHVRHGMDPEKNVRCNMGCIGSNRCVQYGVDPAIDGGKTCKKAVNR